MSYSLKRMVHGDACQMAICRPKLTKHDTESVNYPMDSQPCNYGQGHFVKASSRILSSYDNVKLT